THCRPCPTSHLYQRAGNSAYGWANGFYARGIGTDWRKWLVADRVAAASKHISASAGASWSRCRTETHAGGRVSDGWWFGGQVDADRCHATLRARASGDWSCWRPVGWHGAFGIGTAKVV